MFKQIKTWIKRLIASIVAILAVWGLASLGNSSIQSKAEITDIIAIQQELCLLETGHYCQFLAGGIKPSDQIKDWATFSDNKIKEHDYDIIINTHELHGRKWYSVKYIDPPDQTVTSTDL